MERHDNYQVASLQNRSWYRRASRKFPCDVVAFLELHCFGDCSSFLDGLEQLLPCMPLVYEALKVADDIRRARNRGISVLLRWLPRYDLRLAYQSVKMLTPLNPEPAVFKFLMTRIHYNDHWQAYQHLKTFETLQARQEVMDQVCHELNRRQMPQGRALDVPFMPSRSDYNTLFI